MKKEGLFDPSSSPLRAKIVIFLEYAACGLYFSISCKLSPEQRLRRHTGAIAVGLFRRIFSPLLSVHLRSCISRQGSEPYTYALTCLLR